MRDMKLEAGKVLNLVEESRPVPGCTISEELHRGKNPIWVFSLGADTDISAEIFPYHKLILVQEGTVALTGARPEPS